MMQKRKLNSLLLISFIVVVAASLSFADQVTIQSKYNLSRCAAQAVDVTLENSSDAKGIEFVFTINEGASGGFLEVTSIEWDPAITAVFPDLVVDLSQASNDGPQDTIRFAAMDLTGAGVLAAGTYTAATINFVTSDVCYDTVLIDNGVFSYPNPTAEITTQYVNSEGAIVPVQVTPGNVGIRNSKPVITEINDTTLHWGDFLSVSASADDPDLSGACEELSYSKIAGPANLQVNSSTGQVTWQTTGEDVCTHTVSVAVLDKCDAADTTTFEICVQNDPPEITCPEDQLLFFGNTLVVSPDTAFDPDEGPYALTFGLASTDAPGTVMVDPATGEVTWETEATAQYTGTFQICLSVSDSANICDPCSPRNADTCCFLVEVVSEAITIEKQHGDGGNGVIQGQETTVSIDMLGPEYNNYPIAGFDFLIQYDPTALSFMYAEEGEFFLDCKWEYFTYRYGPYGNCGNGCPSGIVRIVGIAETNNGAVHPDCFVNDGVADPGPGSSTATQLALMHFLVSSDFNLECQLVPIRFIWYDCGDNTLSSVSGDTLMISRWVFDYVGDEGMDTYMQIDEEHDFPSIYGANASCDVYTEKGEPVEFVDFWNGGVDIICKDSIDAPGDINVNAIPYEIADAVMFTNYFIEGLSAFGTHPDASIAASDVNADGVALTIADLVYLIRVVVGDALPYPKEVVAQTVNYTVSNGVVSTQGDVQIGGAYMVVEGRVTPNLLATDMDMEFRYDDESGNTRIVVYSMEPGHSFNGNFIQVDGQILTLEMATYAGLPILAENVPTDYALEQNYPNPFNPTTTVAFATPAAGDYKLTIYNINGQVVDVFSGSVPAPGTYNIEWDASNNASGVYLYRFEMNNFSMVKKAVLLK
jgi:hypothetical protein